MREVRQLCKTDVPPEILLNVGFCEPQLPWHKTAFVRSRRPTQLPVSRCKKSSYKAVPIKSLFSIRQACICEQAGTGRNSVVVTRVARAVDPPEIKIVAENPLQLLKIKL